MSADYIPYISTSASYTHTYIGEVISRQFTLIYPIFDVESIGEVPRGPRAHLDVN